MQRGQLVSRASNYFRIRNKAKCHPLKNIRPELHPYYYATLHWQTLCDCLFTHTLFA